MNTKIIASVAASVAVAAAGGQTVAASTGAAAVGCSNGATAPKLAGKPVRLTGIYDWNLGTFYVRQVGTCVYLMGQSKADGINPAGVGFTSIFIGGITATLTVKGIWSDLPRGDVTGSGNIVWKISQPNGVVTLTVLSSSGGWGATRITRTKVTYP